MIDVSSDEIHLWTLDYQTVSRAALAIGRPALTESEREQVGRFYFERDRIRYLATRILVRSVLSQYADLEPSAWRFEVNAYGRPQIANPGGTSDRLHFNISHTHSLIVVGVTKDAAIGIDVENVIGRPAALEIAPRFFAPSEAAALAKLQHEHQHERFFEYWTFKESYIKARGMGLSLPLDAFSFDLEHARGVSISIQPQLQDDPARWRFWQMRPHERYLLAICAERLEGRPPPRLIVRDGLPVQSHPHFPLATTRSSSATD